MSRWACFPWEGVKGVYKWREDVILDLVYIVVGFKFGFRFSFKSKLGSNLAGET